MTEMVRSLRSAVVLVREHFTANLELVLVCRALGKCLKYF